MVPIGISVMIFISSIGYFRHWYSRDEYDYDLRFTHSISLWQTLLSAVFNLALFFGKRSILMIKNYKNDTFTVLVSHPVITWIDDWNNDNDFVTVSPVQSTHSSNNKIHLESE